MSDSQAFTAEIQNKQPIPVPTSEAAGQTCSACSDRLDSSSGCSSMKASLHEPSLTCWPTKLAKHPPCFPSDKKKQKLLHPEVWRRSDWPCSTCPEILDTKRTLDVQRVGRRTTTVDIRGCTRYCCLPTHTGVREKIFIGTIGKFYGTILIWKWLNSVVQNIGCLLKYDIQHILYISHRGHFTNTTFTADTAILLFLLVLSKESGYLFHHCHILTKRRVHSVTACSLFSL